ncbi:hypothetical protein Hanom_Chr00s000721g01655891 [Helianthus anomalus]
MQAPVTREFNLAIVCSDPNLTIKDFNPSYAEDNYYISSPFTNFANSQPRIFATILHRVNVQIRCRVDLRILEFIRKRKVHV